MNSRLTILCTVLLALPGAAVHAQATSAARHDLPELTVDLSPLSYPSAAQRAGVQGRVLVAFNITRKGRADAVEAIVAEPVDTFDSVAIKAVKLLNFAVPDDWQTTGGTIQRFQLSVLFKLNPCVAPTCVSPMPHESADDFLIIGAQAR